MQVAKHRGYTTTRAIADALASTFEMTPRSLQNKLNSGKFSKEECEVIGSFFEMSMKEYYDTFMCNLFRINDQGHYVCHVDRPYTHLHVPKSEVEMINKTMPKNKQILEQIEKLK